MDPDQEICLCFHVTRRKLDRFLRLEQPRRAAQLAECYGAGTGCGWCRQFLVAMFQAAQGTADDGQGAQIPAAEQYRELRRQYRQTQRAEGSKADAAEDPQPRPGGEP